MVFKANRMLEKLFYTEGVGYMKYLWFGVSCVVGTVSDVKLIPCFLRVRSMALKHLMFHLTTEEGANLKRPLLNGGVLSSVPNLFIVEKPIQLKLDETKESVFKVKKNIMQIGIWLMVLLQL